MPKPLTVWITINCRKFWEIGIPDHLTCLLRNLYAGQEATVRTGHGTTDWFQIGKGVPQGCILSPCLFNLYQSTSCECQAEWSSSLKSRLLGEISIASAMQMTPLYGRKQRGNKEPLDESERGEWKGWLKTQHSKSQDHGMQSHHFMGSRCGNSGNSVRLLGGAPKSLQMVIAVMKLKDAYSLEGKLWPT